MLTMLLVLMMLQCQGGVASWRQARQKLFNTQMLIQQFNGGTVGEDSAAVSTELVPDTTEHLHQNKRHMKKSSACVLQRR